MYFTLRMRTRNLTCSGYYMYGKSINRMNEYDGVVETTELHFVERRKKMSKNYRAIVANKLAS